MSTFRKLPFVNKLFPDESKTKPDNSRRKLTKGMIHVMKHADHIPFLLAHLLRQGVITEDDQERIQARVTKADKMEELMMMLCRRGPHAFDKLYTALMESANEHVARMLDNVSTNEDATSEQVETETNAAGHTESKIEGKGKTVLIEMDGNEKAKILVTTSDCCKDSELDEDAEIEELVNLFMFLHDELKKSLNYYPDTEEFHVNRFKSNNALHGVNPKWRYSNWIRKVQFFTVNCPIWITKICFYGPAGPETNTSYTIWVKLIKGTRMEPIGFTHQVVQAGAGQLIYVPFRFPVGIEPHIRYKLEFQIIGSDRILVAYPRDKLASVTRDCGQLGNVRFDFSSCSLDSTCQIPSIWFYKGKERLNVIPTVFPESSAELVAFETQRDVRLWQKYWGDPNSNIRLGEGGTGEVRYGRSQSVGQQIQMQRMAGTIAPVLQNTGNGAHFNNGFDEL